MIALIKGILEGINFMKKKLSKVCMSKEYIPWQESFDSKKVVECGKCNELMKTMTFGLHVCSYLKRYTGILNA